jgi:hypothetical protein
MSEKKDPRLARAGVSGYNQPKRTPSHPTKSHVVVAKSGDQVKTIRFGEQGAKTAGAPKSGESEAMKKKRASFKARHASNISKGKMSAAFWADKVKWTLIPSGIIFLLVAGETHAELQLENRNYVPVLQSYEAGSR